MTDAGGSTSRRDRVRRVLRWVRVGLGAVGVLCLIAGAVLSETVVPLDIAGISALILIPLGGFVWWPVAASPSDRRAELVAAVLRWIGAGVGAAGLAAMFVGPLFVDDERGVVTVGAFAAAGSAFAALLVRRPPLSPARRVEHRRAKWQLTYEQRLGRTELQLFAEIEHETLVSRRSRPEPRPYTIRPSIPDGRRPPLGMARWLHHAELSTDGTTISVTDHTGKAWRFPLHAAENGVAGLVTLHETIDFQTPGSRFNELREYEQLSLVNAEQERVLDMELYGWAVADLRAFAEAAGLSFERHRVPGTYTSYTDDWRRKPLTPLQVRFPPAPNYWRMPHRLVIPGWIFIFAAMMTGAVLWSIFTWGD